MLGSLVQESDARVAVPVLDTLHAVVSLRLCHDCLRVCEWSGMLEGVREYFVDDLTSAHVTKTEPQSLCSFLSN